MHLDCGFVTEAVVSTDNEATLGGRGMERALTAREPLEL